MTQDVNDTVVEETQAPEEAQAPKAKVEAKPQTGKLQNVPKTKASYFTTHGGEMVNPLTLDRFTGSPSKGVAGDAWLDLQVGAGKLSIDK